MNLPPIHQIRALVVASIIVVTWPAFIGYLTTVINAPQEILEDFMRNASLFGQILTTTEQQDVYWSTYASIIYWSGGVGSFCWPALFGPRVGYRRTVQLMSLLVMIGCTLQTMAKPFAIFELLIVGRTVCGLAFGILAAGTAVFLNDILPVHLRGAFNSLVHLSCWLGSAISVPVSSRYNLGTEDLWHLAFMPPLAWAFLLGVSSLWFPESPVYLSSFTASTRRASYERIENASRFYFGEKSAFFDKFNQAIPTKHGCSKSAAWKWSWKNVGRICLCVLAGGANGLTFFVATSIYFTEFTRKNLHFSTDASQSLAFAFLMTTVLFSVIATFCIHRLGRRFLMLSSLAVVTLGHLTLFGTICHHTATNVLTHGHSWGFITGNLLVLVGFNFGVGCLGNFVASEIVPREQSNLAQGFGIWANFTFNAIAVFTFYPLMKLMGSYIFLMLAGVNLTVLLIFLRWFEEPKFQQGPFTDEKSGGEKTENEQTALLQH